MQRTLVQTLVFFTAVLTQDVLGYSSCMKQPKQSFSSGRLSIINGSSFFRLLPSRISIDEKSSVSIGNWLTKNRSSILVSINTVDRRYRRYTVRKCDVARLSIDSSQTVFPDINGDYNGRHYYLTMTLSMKIDSRHGSNSMKNLDWEQAEITA